MGAEAVYRFIAMDMQLNGTRPDRPILPTNEASIADEDPDADRLVGGSRVPGARSRGSGPLARGLCVFIRTGRRPEHRLFGQYRRMTSAGLTRLSAGARTPPCHARGRTAT